MFDTVGHSQSDRRMHGNHEGSITIGKQGWPSPGREVRGNRIKLRWPSVTPRTKEGEFGLPACSLVRKVRRVWGSCPHVSGPGRKRARTTIWITRSIRRYAHHSGRDSAVYLRVFSFDASSRALRFTSIIWWDIPFSCGWGSPEYAKL